MVIGNVVGLGWCLLQSKLGFMELDPTVYYLDKVPVSIDVTYILLLNLGTLLVCLSALIIPSMVISRVDPVKSIKFN
jgi:lipoprotein-releasing system permease protein